MVAFRFRVSGGVVKSAKACTPRMEHRQEGLVEVNVLLLVMSRLRLILVLVKQRGPLKQEVSQLPYIR